MTKTGLKTLRVSCLAGCLQAGRIVNLYHAVSSAELKIPDVPRGPLLTSSSSPADDTELSGGG